MKRHKISRIYFLCYFLSCVTLILGEVSEESSITKVYEKYLCDLTFELRKNSSEVEFDNLPNNRSISISSLENASVENNGSQNKQQSHSQVKASSVQLACSSNSLQYKNISESEFIIKQERFRNYDKGSFCVANVYKNHSSGEEMLILQLCQNDPDYQVVEHEHEHSKSAPTGSISIRKCCRKNERLQSFTIVSPHENDRIEHKCVPISPDSKKNIWDPPIFNGTTDDYSKHKDLRDFQIISYEIGIPSCSNKMQPEVIENSKDIWFLLLEDGSVQIGLKFWFKPVWLPVEDKKFCLDEVVDQDYDPSSHKIYHKNLILLSCGIENFDDYLFHRRLFGGMCVTAAGIVFILLIIYISIWDKQNLAGWTQFNIFVALFFVVLFEGVRTLLDVNSLLVQSTLTCVIIAAVAQYFFFALNTTWTVMCGDLFYMFWKLETTSKTISRYTKRLICYLLFSWGLPLVVVCVAFYFSHNSAIEEMNEMKGVYAFAHRRCSSPIRNLGFQTQGIMFLMNLVFFLCTTALIWKHRRGLNPAMLKSRNERHTWRSVCLFVKLVVVMGVTSLSIPLDYFFGSSDPLSGIAVMFRLFHFIPFVAVLFIFGFNDKNVALISQKFPRFGKYFRFLACKTSGANGSDTINHSRSGNVNRTSDQNSSQT